MLQNLSRMYVVGRVNEVGGLEKFCICGGTAFQQSPKPGYVTRHIGYALRNIVIPFGEKLAKISSDEIYKLLVIVPNNIVCCQHPLNKILP